MVTENKNHMQRFIKNKQFLQNYHDNVVTNNKQGIEKTPEGNKEVTMKIVGLEIGGKEYLLPSYNPETMSIMTRQEIVDKFMPLIQESLIEGYKDPNEAELDRQLMYPTIVGDMQSINTDIQQFKQAIN
jgi:hypothetical protein|tara:strand:+ start:3290 stop:3676 length:387 start_codon:yes stop_codon:yes gene_type:complete